MKIRPKSFRPNKEVREFIDKDNRSTTEIVNAAVMLLMNKCPLCGSKIINNTKLEEPEEPTKDEIEDFLL